MIRNPSEEWPHAYADLPLTKAEQQVYGSDAERCPETGFIYECGIGAVSRAEQTKQFKAQLNDPQFIECYLRHDPAALALHPELRR
jgi:hypothetical protein